MRIRRFQLTIGHLLGLIAVCAVLLVLLRTEIPLVALAFAIALPGFWVERSRGGSGILGGALSTGFGAGALHAAGSPMFFPYAASFGDAVYQFFYGLYFVTLAAFVCGALWSLVLWAIVAPLGAIVGWSERAQSRGPIGLHSPEE
jgi:hypothetical protein